MRPGIPGRTPLRDDTLSPNRAEIGMALISLKPRAAAKPTKLDDDLVENGLVEVDQIHLVHRQNHMADAQKACDDGMPPRLAEQALASVDQQNREVGIGGAGRHVAGILLVAWCVGDNEGAPLRRKIPVGHIDGDALLPLSFQAVEQQREIDIRCQRCRASSKSRSSAARWSSKMRFCSCSSRPINVDLPSSTEPQVRNRKPAAFISSAPGGASMRQAASVHQK